MTEKKIKAELSGYGIHPEAAGLLVCVSGGPDSMVLSALLNQLGFSFIIAHVNYGLRGKDADEDMDMVIRWAKQIDKPIEILDAKHLIAQKKQGESLQMRAREIRYSWWNKLLEKHHLDFIVTGHQGEDNVETFFINLLRGSGTRGLAAMQVKKDNILRPLLCLTRDEILKYAQDHGIPWREDRSNLKDDYLRNKIRHNILPAFLELKEDYVNIFGETFQRIQNERQLHDFLIQRECKLICSDENSSIIIQKKGLKIFPDPALVLYECLKSKGFSYLICKNACRDFMQSHGQEFYSDEWTLRSERAHFEVKSRNQKYLIKNTTQIDDFTITEMLKEQFGKIKFSADVAYLDSDKIKQKLDVRNWKKGDYFYPAGMRGRKLLSDYFTELKFSKEEKDNQLIITHGNEIVWIVGRRVDRRFAADNSSEKITRIVHRENISRY